ncbi:MAG: CAP domain-containing protein [Candidatus Saccharimonadota bacterium]
MKTKQTTNKKRTQTRSTPTQSSSIHAKVRHHAKRILVPHKVNDYRPHLIRAHGIIAVLVVALLAQLLYGYAATGKVEVLSRVSSIQTTDLLIDTNDEREAEGLADLQLNDSLSRAALLKAQDMFEAQYWAHVSPSGVEPWKWFGDVGYTYSVAGENLAKNYPTSQATVDAWMNSETHRANILNGSFKEVGFAVLDGYLNDENTTLVVALYAAPAAATVQPGTSRAAGASGDSAETSFLAPVVLGQSGGIEGYVKSALQSLSPVTLLTLALLAVIAGVGVLAHHHRNKLPKAWRRSWKQHHGMYTFVGMIALGVLIIIATGAGQI